MRILIIGSGAREHAIAKALARSAQTPSLYCYGTSVNPGIHQLSKEYYTGDKRLFLAYCQSNSLKIDIAIIGPEAL